MFEKLTKTEMKDIYLDYVCSKEDGRRCECFVPYAEKYKEQLKIGELLSLSEAISIVTDMFFKEVAKRYFCTRKT